MKESPSPTRLTKSVMSYRRLQKNSLPLYRQADQLLWLALKRSRKVSVRYSALGIFQTSSMLLLRILLKPTRRCRCTVPNPLHLPWCPSLGASAVSSMATIGITPKFSKSIIFFPSHFSYANFGQIRINGIGALRHNSSVLVGFD